MKKKYFFVILFLVLAMFLSGCGIITDEEKIRDVIDEYFLAINEQDWDKAKSYCLCESNVYYETCSLEDQIDALYQFADVVTVTCLIDIFDIVISCFHASACCDGDITIIADDYYINSDGSGYLYLQRVGSSWKICDFGPEIK